MNKAEFSKELRDILAGKLPPEELDDVLSYYEAYFADSEEDEETVAERLGSPASVAEQVLKDRNEPPKETPAPQPDRQKSRILLPVLVIVGAAILALLLYALLFRPQTSGPVLLPGQTADAIQTPDIQGDWEGEVEPFSKLDIAIGLGNVQVEEGDGWRLRLVNRGWDSRYDASQELKYSQDGDTLSVWSTSDNIASGESSPDVRVLVTVPKGTILEQADLSTGVGDVDWDACAVSGKLRTESGVGDVHVSAPLGVADLSAGVGDVTLKLAAPVEKADLIAGTGDVTLEITGDQSDYSWNMSTGTGDIRLNGKTADPFTFTATGGNGDRSLSLTSGTGDVSLEFQ